MVKKYAAGDLVEGFEPTGYAEGLSEIRKQSDAKGLGDKSGSRLQAAIDRHLADRVAKNKGTQVAANSYARGGEVSRIYHGASEGPSVNKHTVLSSGRAVKSTHDHLMSEGKKMGYR